MPGDVAMHPSLDELHRVHLKRTADLFGDAAQRPEPDEASLRRKLACKVRDEYAAVAHLPPPTAAQPGGGDGQALFGSAAKPARAERETAISKLLSDLPGPGSTAGGQPGGDQQVVVFRSDGARGGPGAQGPVATASTGGALSTVYNTKRSQEPTSTSIVQRMAAKWPRPEWHAPWRCYRVLSGHLGWVRSVAVDPTNQWFVTGSADRCIKVWDLASGQLKLTLTGHIEQVTGLAVSDRHPYLFSCGLDKMVKCWDLEYNKVIRHYHGHLSGIYSLALHPQLDVLFTGGRDSTCRVWDMRTKAQVFCLSGHDNTVCSILSQAPDPQVITGSHDATIRMWDLRTGKTLNTLTHHKKSVRAMAMHPQEFTFASASADNIKKWQLPTGAFLHNTLQQQRAIVNTVAVNAEGVMATGGDNGSLWMWDWRSGNCFQQQETLVQPGSLESEGSIFAAAFDMTGSRLITCEGDKTVKMWKEDPNASQESHPIVFKPPKDLRRY